MKIEILKTKEEIGKRAAKEFIDVIQKNPEAILGLATGSSPIELYKNLVQAYSNEEISFKNVKTFNLDEYVNIDKNHPQSYFTFMNQNLFSEIDINMNNVNIPAGVGNLEEICKDYNKKLEENVRDIQILGIGTNGHIAFNEPGTKFTQITHITQLAEQTINDNTRFFDKKEDVPTQAISMGLSNIMDSKKIVLIATGKNKASAIKQMIEGKQTEELPASILQNHKDVLILIDEEAASKLKN